MLRNAGLGLLCGFVSTSVCALEVVFTPVADTVIYFGEGFSETASNALGGNLSVGQTADGVARRSLIRFDLGSIAPGSVVESVQLTLFESRSRANYDVSVHRLMASWGEGTSNGGSATGASGVATPGDATWLRSVHPDTLWSSPGGDFTTLASATTFVDFAGESYNWSSAGMRDDAQAWIDNPAVNFGWILIGEEVTNQNVKLFGSRESGTVPTLTLQITPVPEPSTYATMAIGVGLIAWRLRQRQRRGRNALLA